MRALSLVVVGVALVGCGDQAAGPSLDAPVVDVPVGDAPALDAPALDAPIDALALDAPGTDAASIDATALLPCGVEATFAVAAPGATTGLHGVPIDAGWVFGYLAGGEAWWTVHAAGGAVLTPPTSLGPATALRVVRGADRVLIVVDATIHALDLDGTLATATHALPATPAVLTPGPGTSFYAVTTQVIVPMWPARPSQLNATVYTVDRDGATTAFQPPQLLVALGLGGAVPAPGGATLIGATQYAAVGGCLACSSGGFVTMSAAGAFGAVVALPRGPFEAAFLDGLAVAGDRTYVASAIWTELGAHVRAEWMRTSLATLEVRAGAPPPSLVPLGTGPRAGVRGQWGGGVPPTIQAFTDDAAFALGATCQLPGVPQRIAKVDADTIEVIGDGQVWLVTTP